MGKASGAQRRITQGGRVIDPDVLQWISVGKDTGILTVVVSCAVLAIKKFERMTNVLKDFPPHRHINGNITYPMDFEPSRVEKMDYNRQREGNCQ
jgi:hypothetical protein